VNASMTVNTKEALKVVMGMFNVSDDVCRNSPLEKVHFETQFAADTG